MHDFKNISLAWFSSITSIFAAVEARTLITIISAIVLPIIFFTLGKTADVLLQIYFRKLEEERRDGGGK
jgi:nicotinamide riboside transporter PnuC